MSVAIRCSSCQTDYRVNERLRGKRVKCRICGAGVRVPRKQVKILAAIAVLLVVGFVGGVIVLGRSLGFFGGQFRTTAVIKKPPTPQQLLERDRSATRANLVRIGQSLEIWARYQKGMYPPRLVDTLEIADLPAANLRSPFGGEYAYLYFRSMGTAMAEGTPVAYDVAELRLHGRAHVLFADGEVRPLEAQELEKAIAQAADVRMGLVQEKVAATRRGD
jgi:hypothetical protein